MSNFDPNAGSQFVDAGRGGVPPPGTAYPGAHSQLAEQPPPYTESSAQKINTDRQNNWPPLPKKFPIGPCFYQDFSVDIPLEFQRTVKFVYYLWIFYSIVLFLNVWGSLAYLCVDGDGGVTFGLSFVWLVLFTPCSFLCWYRPLYKAFRSDSSINFFVFFFIFFVQAIVCLIQCVGITNFTVGWINALKVVGHNAAAGAIMLFIALFFSICAVLEIILLIRVHRIYRSTGASFDKAKAEFSSGAMTN